jgi:glycerophosphoryl diester phosphodiesterase
MTGSEPQPGRYSPRPDVPRRIAHRGASAQAPENTIPAFEAAARLGATWVEFDVMLSADGVPVVIHDETLRRTTGVDGWVAQTHVADLMQLDAGRWFAPKFAGARIPSLSQTLDALARLGLGANVEIKPTVGAEAETGRVVARALADSWPVRLPPPVVSSFSTVAIRAAHACHPAHDYAPIFEHVPDDWPAHLDAVGGQAVHCNAQHLTRAKAQEILATGAAIRCYTVNDGKTATRLADWGVSTVFTDMPPSL